MGRIKQKPEDEIKIDVRPVNNNQSAPHIVGFVNRYGTDHKGEMTGMVNLQDCSSKQEILLALGQLLLDSSKNVQKWMANMGIE